MPKKSKSTIENKIHIHIGDKSKKRRRRKGKRGGGGGGGGYTSFNVSTQPQMIIPQFNKPQHLDLSTANEREKPIRQLLGAEMNIPKIVKHENITPHTNVNLMEKDEPTQRPEFSSQSPANEGFETPHPRERFGPILRPSTTVIPSVEELTNREYIINRETGRRIRIDGPTYKKIYGGSKKT